MLDRIDISKSLDKKSYKQSMKALALRLSEAQRTCRDEKIPVIVLFEGWSAAGKGSRMGSLIRNLDPRGFETFTIQAPTEEEILHPYMWRFWRRTPATGRIHVFDRSWYRILMLGKEETDVSLSDPVRDILSFETMLADTGIVVVKLFLHISRKEQKKRLKALSSNPDTVWRVSKGDWAQNRSYSEYQVQFERMLEQTDHDRAKWAIIEANDSRFADVKIYLTVVEAMEEAVRIARAKSEDNKPSAEETMPLLMGVRSSALEAVDLCQRINSKEYRQRLNCAQTSLSKLHNTMYRKRVPAAILFEGWDAAGKGGAIKRLAAPLDPRGYKVAPSSAPSDTESAHHYLWRYWNDVPKAGHMTIFDRSWYGRVMVERIEGFCTQDEWRRAFKEINEFEEQLVDSGIVLVKFWLHIDQDEQLKRFERRVSIPEKQWKITDEDWRNRAKWNQYLEAVDEMLFRTSTTYAPWTIVEAVNKKFARVKVIETVQKKLKERLNGDC